MTRKNGWCLCNNIKCIDIINMQPLAFKLIFSRLFSFPFCRCCCLFVVTLNIPQFASVLHVYNNHLAIFYCLAFEQIFVLCSSRVSMHVGISGIFSFELLACHLQFSDRTLHKEFIFQSSCFCYIGNVYSSVLYWGKNADVVWISFELLLILFI